MPPPTPRCSSVWTSLYRIPVPRSSLEETHLQATKTAIPLLETTLHTTFVCSRGWRSQVYSCESPAWGALHQLALEKPRWALPQVFKNQLRHPHESQLGLSLLCQGINLLLFSPWSLLYEIINCECLQENDLSCLKFFSPQEKIGREVDRKNKYTDPNILTLAFSKAVSENSRGKCFTVLSWTNWTFHLHSCFILISNCFF